VPTLAPSTIVSASQDPESSPPSTHPPSGQLGRRVDLDRCGCRVVRPEFPGCEQTRLVHASVQAAHQRVVTNIVVSSDPTSEDHGHMSGLEKLNVLVKAVWLAVKPRFV